jgi:hypothetical protein
MKTHQWMAVVGVGALVTACGGHDVTTTSDYAEAFGQHIDALGAEQVAHSAEISAVTRIDLVASVEQGHAERMDDHLAWMSRVMGGMMSCVDLQGSPFDAANLAVTTHDLHSECDEHGMLMLSAHDMDTARAEEARHQLVVGKQIEKLRRQLGTMISPGSAYRCSPCPHCGM